MVGCGCGRGYGVAVSMAVEVSLAAAVSMDFCRLSAVYHRVGRHNNFSLIRLSTSYKIAMSSEST